MHDNSLKRTGDAVIGHDFSQVRRFQFVKVSFNKCNNLFL